MCWDSDPKARYIFHIQKVNTVSRFSQHPTVLTYDRARLAYPASSLNFQLRSWASPPLRSSSLYNLYILAPLFFLPLSTFSLCVHMLFLFPLFFVLLLMATSLVWLVGTNEPARDQFLNNHAFLSFNLVWIGSFHQRRMFISTYFQRIFISMYFASSINRIHPSAYYKFFLSRSEP